MVSKFISSLALAASLPIFAVGCTSTTAKAPNQQSWYEKLGSSVKSGTDKMTAAIAPKQPSFKDQPLPSPNGKAGPNVFVAMAQMNERQGDLDAAEANYKRALEKDSKNLDALVGYARLHDRMSNFEAAERYYQRAIKRYPKDASIHNDLGLCYHRHGQLDNATQELRKAVAIESDSKLYRNNLAAVYVEQGKNGEALTELTAAHGKAVAHYNLGYLLMQRKENTAAVMHFHKSMELDPQLAGAQEWIAKLSPGSNFASPADGSAIAAGVQAPANTNATYVATRPPGAPPQYTAPPQHYTAPTGQPAQTAPGVRR